MNSLEIEGFTSFSKVQNFNGGQFSHRFSITLQAGKDRDGNYRKEYIDVRLSSDCSQALQYPGDGTRIKVKGRLRCEPWIDRNQQKRKAIYVEAFEAQVIQPPNPQFQQQAQTPPPPPPLYQQYNHYGQGAGNHGQRTPPPPQQQGQPQMSPPPPPPPQQAVAQAQQQNYQHFAGDDIPF
jgi:single-stranded DNA-binding protein